jgi:hypothetical protein
MIKRLAVLRLASTNLVYAKEPESPVVLALFLLEPLSDPQMRHLAIAAPWSPVMIEVEIDNTWHGLGFGARISVIETMPKIQTFQPRRRLKAGLYKRKRGFLFHD